MLWRLIPSSSVLLSFNLKKATMMRTEYIEEARRRPNQSQMILKDLFRQQQRNAADKQGGRRPARAVVTLVGSLYYLSMAYSSIHPTANNQPPPDPSSSPPPPDHSATPNAIAASSDVAQPSTAGSRPGPARAESENPSFLSRLQEVDVFLSRVSEKKSRSRLRLNRVAVAVKCTSKFVQNSQYFKDWRSFLLISGYYI